MAQWRKVIVSGSNSELNHITSSGDFHFNSDGAKLRFGADAEVTLTHEHDGGLILSDASGVGTTKLSFGDNATFVQQQADGELGIDADVKIDITAPAVSMSNDLYVGGDIKAVGDITFNAGSGGNITLGSANDDNVVFSADVNSNIIPNTDAAFDLGSTDKGWNDLHLGSGGVINLDGGDVTLTHSAGKITLGGDADVEFDFANHEMTNVDINSGAIDGTTIGGESAAVGTFTTLTATTLGGALNANSQEITNVDIDSGAIDNTVIGGATPAAGTFTTLGATGISSLDGDVNLGNALTDDVNLKGHLTGSAGAHVSMSISSTGSFGMLASATLKGRPGITLDGTTISATPSSTIDLDAGGAITIDGATVSIGGDSDTGAITADSTAGISLDAAAASNFTVAGANLVLNTTTSGDIDLTAAANLDLDGGSVDIDSTAAISLDAGAASNFTTSDGALTLSGGTGVAIQENGTDVIAIDTNRDVLFSQTGGDTSDPDVQIDGYSLLAGQVEVSNTTTSTSKTTGALVVDGGVGINENLNVGGNVSIEGNLDVDGTLTTIDTTNLQVKDAFVHLASGSNSQTNAGIVANTTADGSGSAFYFDGTNGYNRWALTGADETGHSATGDIVPRQYVMTVSSSAQSPAIGAVPSDFGGASGNSRLGMVYIQTDATAASSSVAGDIWIYS